MWAWLAVGAAMAQSDGALPPCDPTEANAPCEALQAPSIEKGTAVGTERETETERVMRSYAVVERRISPPSPVEPLKVGWEAPAPYRPWVAPDAVGDTEVPNPLRPLDWPGMPAVQIVAPLPATGTTDAQDIDLGPWIRRGTELPE